MAATEINYEPSRSAGYVFHELASRADAFAAHNIEFDRFIVEGEMIRAGYKSIPFKDGCDYFCTMKGMMHHCNLPGGYNGEPKWPKLEEAYEHAFGKKPELAHDAMADVRACSALHFWILKAQTHEHHPV